MLIEGAKEEAGPIGLAKVARLLPAALVARINDPEADDLAAWALRHDLLLVDWCRVQAAPAVAADLARYLAHLA